MATPMGTWRLKAGDRPVQGPQLRLAELGPDKRGSEATLFFFF